MESMEVIFMEYTDVLVEYFDRLFMEHEFTPVIKPSYRYSTPQEDGKRNTPILTYWYNMMNDFSIFLWVTAG